MAELQQEARLAAGNAEEAESLMRELADRVLELKGEVSKEGERTCLCRSSGDIHWLFLWLLGWACSLGVLVGGATKVLFCSGIVECVAFGTLLSCDWGSRAFLVPYLSFAGRRRGGA